MSQQINLYEERLRPNREWLTGRRLALAVVLVLAAFAVWGVVERRAADDAAAQLAGLQGELTASQQKLTALGKALAERKVSAALKAEIDGARAQLASHKAVMALLDAGQLGNQTGFSAVMRGFSHLASNDLWLTGFTVAAGGHEIEIRGRLIEAGALSAYVQRLANEPAFKGMRFAALDLQREVVDKGAAKAPANASDVAKPSADTTSMSRTLDFVLRSEKVGETQTGSAAKSESAARPLADSTTAARVPDLAQLPEGAGEALSAALTKK